MIRGFIFLVLLHLSFALFEICDETLKLETDEILTISSVNILNVKSALLCRIAIVAPVNFIIDVTCLLKIDQPDSQKCPLKRFFVSVDGRDDLHGADYFCNRNGTTRTIRKSSVMNRLVLAYVTAEGADGNESFSCVAKRIASRCDCGWSQSVSRDCKKLLNFLEFFCLQQKNSMKFLSFSLVKGVDLHIFVAI